MPNRTPSEIPGIGYSERVLDGTLREGDDETEANLPFGLDGQGSQWVDLDGEGLSGVLTEQAGAWFYKRNLGDGRLSTMEPIDVAPNVRRGAHLAAIEGSGAPRLLVRDAWGAGVFERDDVTGAWSSFAPFTSWPKIDWSDPHLRALDLDGDGEPGIGHPTAVCRARVIRWRPDRSSPCLRPHSLATTPRSLHRAAPCVRRYFRRRN